MRRLENCHVLGFSRYRGDESGFVSRTKVDFTPFIIVFNKQVIDVGTIGEDMFHDL